MNIPDATDSLAVVAPAALALPAASRAVLADLLLSSLETGVPDSGEPLGGGEASVDEMAERLTAHFHEAKQAALARAAATAQIGVTNAAHD